MPTMIREKKAQKILYAIIGKPDAMKRKKKTKTEKVEAQKAEMSDQYRRTYGV